MLPAHVVTRPRPQCFPAGTIKGNPETTKPSELLGSDGCLRANDALCNDPDGSRTRVTAVKGQCPRPLDDGAACLLAMP